MDASQYQQWLHQQPVVAATQSGEEKPPVSETAALEDRVSQQLHADPPSVSYTGAAPEENWAMGSDWRPMPSQAWPNQQPASVFPQQANASQHKLHYADVLILDCWKEMRELRREVYGLHEMVDLMRQEVNGLHGKLDQVLHTIKKNSNKIHLIHPVPPDPLDDADPPDPARSQVIVYDPPPPPGDEYQ